MKREFSFYEFVGIMVPSVTLLFFLQELYVFHYQSPRVVDYTNIGESIIFLVIAYGFGHLLHAVSNLYEYILWKIAGGMPSQWLLRKNNFGKTLFDDHLTYMIRDKLIANYGDDRGNDYGRLVLSKLRSEQKAATLEIFNGNYSLSRGLAVAFLILAVLCFGIGQLSFGWSAILICAIATYRMIRFSLYFARELYRCYLNNC